MAARPLRALVARTPIAASHFQWSDRSIYEVEEGSTTMARIEPILLGALLIILMYVFPVPGMRESLYEELRICAVPVLNTFFNSGSQDLTLYSITFYGGWVLGILLILVGIFWDAFS